MLTPFVKSSYLAQVRRLRELAHLAIEQYPIKDYRLDFINHGENATFKVITKKGNFLLRIHRHNYHTEQALGEELKWLKKLEGSDIPVQKPFKAKNGKYLVKQYSDKVGEQRYCDLLHWQEGVTKYKKSYQDYFNVGVLTAKLHSNTIKTKYRNYWDSEGLLGKNPTFGKISEMAEQFPKECQKLEPVIKKIYKKIKNYEKKNSHKMSVIHSDLHFGNMIWRGSKVAPIDFDDCGYGFQMYDLAVTLYASGNLFKKVGKREAAKYRDALLSGYTSIREISAADLAMIDYFKCARMIIMLGWLYERRDNPELGEYLTSNMKRVTNEVLKLAAKL